MLIFTLVVAAAQPVPEQKAVEAPSSSERYQVGSTEIKSKLDALEDAIADAKTNGIDTSYEEVTAFVAREFQNCIAWDTEHPATWLKITKAYRPLSKNDKAAALAAAIPEQEVADTLTILNRAHAELARVQQRPASRRSVPSNGTARISLDRDYCYQGNRPVFLGTWGWMPDDQEYGRAFGLLPRISLKLTDLPDARMTVPPRVVRTIGNRIRDSAGTGSLLELFLLHNPPVWATNQYPAITVGNRQFVGYDIDHPLVREMWQRYLAQLVPAVAANANGSKVYVLANEPHWFTTKDIWSTGTVSDYTWKKFGKWLAQHYQTNLNVLNQRWHTNFTSFDQVRVPLPMDKEMKGSAIWYDWCRFNMDRVNDWFAFLSTEIKKYDPQALCTIKLISKLCISTNFEKDNGLDFETLTEVQDISGADTDVEAPSDDLFRVQKKPAWSSRYAMDWEVQSMYYDFLKSLAPRKLIFDSEYHAFSAVSWRAPYMGQDYVRSVLWLAHLHGLSMNTAWYLPRLKDGGLNQSLESDIYGSAAMQPIVLDAYGRTMKELNAYAPEIAAFARAPRPVRLFYSTDAAIQSPSFQRTTLRTYEALYFLGVPLGFVTEKMLLSADAADLKQYPILLVPSATHVRETAIAGLKKYSSNGGNLVVIGESALEYDEYGRQRDQRQLSFLNGVPHFGADESAEMIATRVEALFSAAGIKRLIICGGPQEKIPWGVHYLSVQQGTTTLVYLVNLAKNAKAVSLLAGDKHIAEASDLFTNEKTQGQQITLQPYEMRLLSIP